MGKIERGEPLSEPLNGKCGTHCGPVHQALTLAVISCGGYLRSEIIEKIWRRHFHEGTTANISTPHSLPYHELRNEAGGEGPHQRYP